MDYEIENFDISKVRFEEAIYGTGGFDIVEYYFLAPKDFLREYSDTPEYASIHVSFPIGLQKASAAMDVRIGAVYYTGNDLTGFETYDWVDILLADEQIEELLKIAQSAKT